MIEIVQAESPQQLDQVRNLMREFVRWHRQRHTQDLDLINEYFDTVAFEKELASLPGDYAPPRGRLLLALYEGEPAGCVALHELDGSSCEMKRMFVYTRYHGKRIGHALAEALIKEARSMGYETMKLDTSIRQREALQLYESVGFERTEPYYDLPGRLRHWLVFMELNL